MPFNNNTTTKGIIFCCILHSLNRASLKTGKIASFLGKLLNLPREETADYGQSDNHGRACSLQPMKGKKLQQEAGREKNSKGPQ